MTWLIRDPRRVLVTLLLAVLISNGYGPVDCSGPAPAPAHPLSAPRS